jgi:dTDP-4-dehydrorhamnose reductase
MRILILGGSGMLGHTLLQTLSPRHDVRVTLLHSLDHYRPWPQFHAANSYDGVDVRSPAALAQALERFRPQAVVNCVGLVKQRNDAEDVLANLEINAVAPHRIAELCRGVGARLIHVSTDCVFSGRKGMYTEQDVADCDDLYGRSKHLGEPSGPNCLTLRTSFVGRELSRKLGLLEWFLAQRGSINGFRKAIFSGLTAIELSRVIAMLLADFPAASGLYHVSSEAIDKHTLLTLFKDHFRHAVEIVADETFAIDRSLDSSRFRRDFRYRPPAWPAMVTEL